MRSARILARSTLIAMVAVPFVAVVSQAQRPRIVLDSGSTVRITMTSGAIEGTALSLAADSLVLSRFGDWTPERVALGSIRRLEVHGDRNRSFATLLWGGIAAGLTTFLVAVDPPEEGGAAGAIIGNTLIFAAIGGYYRLVPAPWREVPCASLSETRQGSGADVSDCTMSIRPRR